MTSTVVQSAFRAHDYRAVSKNTLLGFFSLTLLSQMVLRDCSLHERNGKRWVGLPCRRTKDGEYEALVDFATKEARDRFQNQALAAVEPLLKEDSNDRASL